MKIPSTGRKRDEILHTLEAYRADDMPWRSGRTWAYVYDPGKEAEEVIKQAYMMYLSRRTGSIRRRSPARCVWKTSWSPWPRRI